MESKHRDYTRMQKKSLIKINHHPQEGSESYTRIMKPVEEFIVARLEKSSASSEVARVEDE